MKSFILFITLLFNNSIDQIKWENAKNWRLFKMPSHIGLRIPIDSLSTYQSVPLDIDRLKMFFNKVEEIKNVNPVWTGLYVASCELDNKKHKILLSRYGGFFFDENSKKYFQISEEYRQDWTNFLNESSKLIDEK